MEPVSDLASDLAFAPATEGLSTTVSKRKPVDCFKTRRAGKETNAASIKSSFEKIQRVVDATVTSAHTSCLQLTYANVYADKLEGHFNFYCSELLKLKRAWSGQKQELLAKDSKGKDIFTGFVIDAPTVKDKTKFPKLLENCQETALKILFLETDFESLEPLYRNPKFTTVYTTCRKIQEASGTLVYSRISDKEKEDKLSEWKTSLFELQVDDNMNPETLAAINRIQTDTLHALSRFANSCKMQSAKVSLLYNEIQDKCTALNPKEKGKSKQKEVEASKSSISDAEIDAYIAGTKLDASRNIDVLFDSWIADRSAWKTWYSRDYYKDVMQVAQGVKKEILIAETLMRDVKKRILEIGTGNVAPAVGYNSLSGEWSYYERILEYLKTNVAQSIKDLFTTPLNDLVPRVSVFTTGLERDITIIARYIELLKEFTGDEVVPAAEAQNAFTAHLAVADTQSREAVETLFTAAKSIWLQEQACLKELGGHVDDSAAGRHIEMTIRMLHEAVSRRGPEILEECDEDMRAWDAIMGHSSFEGTQGLPVHVEAYIERLATEAIYFTKKQNVALEMMLHSLSTRAPFKPHYDAASGKFKEIVADYLAFVGQKALNDTEQELAHNVANWLYHASLEKRDVISFARAWSYQEAITHPALQQFLFDKLTSIAQDQKYVAVSNSIQKKKLDAVKAPFGFSSPEINELLLRAVSLAIWGKGEQQLQGERFIGRLIADKGFPEYWKSCSQDLKDLVYKNAMAKIRLGKSSALYPQELDLLAEGPFADYLKNSNHTHMQDEVGDVLFKLLLRESNSQDKRFSELCRSKLGESVFTLWFEAKRDRTVGWKND